ncbi:cell division protein FtsZ [Niabella drilacis]|uniref:Cell division protein FtsZ n=1 Tax=Niabella drilacis (strain DSM 25811 / CCM 8410 / CCUG 62505 / LMG 26954 / E90) TaxID=1285928 RepID=A0A1G6T1L0_NIADE|nr:cell division protein FtsZ [Niabella drilacis]SDD22928.1 cell division protein FtsZ [Niabella drilacis]
MIHFDLPKEQSSIIKVIGVGGGGGNAVNHMFSQNIDGVNFIICNTDAQALSNSQIPNRIQLGPQLTSGLGAGANPEIGRQATEESLEEIKRIVEVNTKMAFITAGMGGGTGTGGAPIIAKICKDLGVLTVGIVTMPFAYEGKKRHKQAEEGIKILKQYVDTLLVISNDKLRHQFGNLKMREAFEKADNVLATAAKCITDVINSTGQINVDFADVCTVMKNGGVAILGSATSSGENRAQRAIEEALNSPLLNDNDIRGAKWILININSAEGDSEFTMDEVEVIQAHLLSQAGENTDVILGLGYDNSLGDEIGITLIATGFENKDPFVKPVLKKEEQDEGKIVMTLTPQENTAPKIAPRVEAPEVAEHELKEAEKSLGLQVDPMMPKLVDEPQFFDAPMPTLEDMADLGFGKETADVHYTLSAEDNEKIGATAEPEVVKEVTVEIVAEEEQAFLSPAMPSEDRVLEQPVAATGPEQDHSAGVGIRSYLAKPSNIYAEPKREEPVANTPVSNPVEEKMELVEKTDLQRDEVAMPVNHFEKEKPVQLQLSPEEEMQLQKRKQVERLQKLRNLSFNVNGSDPNNEYETVPAYIRRNMELQDNSNHIESYYSKFEVSSDDKNQGQINTINTFLDGKKPD